MLKRYKTRAERILDDLNQANKWFGQAFQEHNKAFNEKNHERAQKTTQLYQKARSFYQKVIAATNRTNMSREQSYWLEARLGDIQCRVNSLSHEAPETKQSINQIASQIEEASHQLDALLNETNQLKESSPKLFNPFYEKQLQPCITTWSQTVAHCQAISHYNYALHLLEEADKKTKESIEQLKQAIEAFDQSADFYDQSGYPDFKKEVLEKKAKAEKKLLEQCQEQPKSITPLSSRKRKGPSPSPHQTNKRISFLSPSSTTSSPTPSSQEKPTAQVYPFSLDRSKNDEAQENMWKERLRDLLEKTPGHPIEQEMYSKLFLEIAREMASKCDQYFPHVHLTSLSWLNIATVLLEDDRSTHIETKKMLYQQWQEDIEQLQTTLQEAYKNQLRTAKRQRCLSKTEYPYLTYTLATFQQKMLETGTYLLDFFLAELTDYLWGIEGLSQGAKYTHCNAHYGIDQLCTSIEKALAILSTEEIVACVRNIQQPHSFYALLFNRLRWFYTCDENAAWRQTISLPTTTDLVFKAELDQWSQAAQDLLMPVDKKRVHFFHSPVDEPSKKFKQALQTHLLRLRRKWSQEESNHLLHQTSTLQKALQKCIQTAYQEHLKPFHPTLP